MTRLATLGVSVDVAAVVAAAVRAPSVHNSQPWRFRPAGGGGVEVYADLSRQLPVTDPVGRGLRVSVGAAVFNVRLALAHQGWSSVVSLLPDPARPSLMAVVRPDRPRPATPEEAELYAALWVRHSNRAPFLDSAVPADVRAHLLDAAHAENAWLDLLVGPAAVGLVAELVRTADRVLTARPEYRQELKDWTRSGTEGVVDGVPADAGGPAPEPQDLLPQRDFGGLPRAPGHDYEPDPLVGVLGTDGDGPRDDLAAGQALQRVLLAATRAGLVTSLMSQPIDLPHIREQLRIGLRRHGAPHILFRAGYGIAGQATPRRPVADVLDGPHGFDGPAARGPKVPVG